MFTVALGIILMKINLDNADQDKNYISGYSTSFQIINKNKLPYAPVICHPCYLVA